MSPARRTPANAQVDAYLMKAGQWQEVMSRLRAILLDTPLTEAFKWGKPCYTLDDKNVVLMIGFKSYCALLFPNGALLKDEQGILVRPTENTQAARQLRITSPQQVDQLEPALKGLIHAAMEVEKAGLKVSLKTIDEYEVPEELQIRLDENAPLKAAFKKLTPGRQRAYLLHISSAKQSSTRASRVEKCLPRILEGKGIDD